MALAAGVASDELRAAGRLDAADALDRINNSPVTNIYTEIGDSGAEVVLERDGIKQTYPLRHVDARNPLFVGDTSPRPGDEIDLIYASKMSPREKLLRIRQVLELRALAEAEEAQAREKAPAPSDAEADENASTDPANNH